MHLQDTPGPGKNATDRPNPRCRGCRKIQMGTHPVIRRAVLFAILSIFWQASPGYAAGSDVSGEWKLNGAKSGFGTFPAPQSITRKIVYKGVRLAVTNVQKGAQGEVTTELVYTTDGKPVTNKAQGGESKGSAQWIGDKLMIESSREVQGVTLTQKDIWSLAGDGRTLTVDSHVTLPNGEFNIKQVFDRQK
jgi:hypothetical protein